MHTVMAQETVTNGMKYLLQLRLYITQIRLQASYNQCIGLIREILTRNQGVFPIKIMWLSSDVCWWLGRPVNAHFLMRFSHRHSVFLCIFYHVYHGFVGWGGVG